MMFDDKEPDLYTPNNPYVVRFVCLSDTHSYHNKVKMPKGDVLLHTGDFTMKGRADEIVSFSKWLAKLPYQHKIVVAGNHELTFDIEKESTIRKNHAIKYPISSNSEEN